MSLHSILHIITQTSCRVDINAQNVNDESTLNNITTIVDTVSARIMKPWLLIDWIFNESELGKEYYRAVKCEQARIINEEERIKRMRETGEKRGQNDEKTSLIDLLIQVGTSAKKKLLEK